MWVRLGGGGGDWAWQSVALPTSPTGEPTQCISSLCTVAASVFHKRLVFLQLTFSVLRTFPKTLDGNHVIKTIIL